MKISPRIAFLVAVMARTVSCFSPPSFGSKTQSSRFMGQSMKLVPVPRRADKSTMNMFLGSDGGLLGIGAPEVATIVLVGYFVLGPSDLYKLVKEIGAFIQNIRTLGVEASKTLEVNLESQLQFEEIRKAQRELNDAFSFRRTINVDDEGEAFSTIPSETRPGLEPIVKPSEDGSKKRKKIRRRKAVVAQEEGDDEAEAPWVDMEQALMNGELGMDVPDLDMSDAWTPDEAMDDDALLRKQRMKERIDRLSGGDDDDVLRQERMDRLSGAGARPPQFEEAFSNPFANPLDQQNRFVEQLSGNWNAKILANEDKLEPLALLMERLAILEEEKNAADARLEEEFRMRAELEEKYYRNKRQILEEAAADVQASAYDTSV